MGAGADVSFAAIRTAISSNSITRPSGTRRRPKLKPALKNQAQRVSRAPASTSAGSIISIVLAVEYQSQPRSSLKIILGCRLNRTDRAQRRHRGCDVDDGCRTRVTTFAYSHDHSNTPTARPLPPRHLRARQPRGNPARPPTSSWRTAVHIETGPHKHAIQQTFFLMSTSPAATRVEVANAGARPSSLRQTGNRSSGRKKSVEKARRGD